MFHIDRMCSSNIRNYICGAKRFGLYIFFTILYVQRIHPIDTKDVAILVPKGKQQKKLLAERSELQRHRHFAYWNFLYIWVILFSHFH